MPDSPQVKPKPDDECESVLWLANLLRSALDEGRLKGKWVSFHDIEKRYHRHLVIRLDEAFDWVNKYIIPKGSPLRGISPLTIPDDEGRASHISLAGVIKEVRNTLSNREKMHLGRIQRVQRTIAALRHYAAEELGIRATGAPDLQKPELLDDHRGGTLRPDAADAPADDPKNTPPAVQEGEAAAGVDKGAQTKHSADFASVRWYGTEYQFTKQQAAAISEWWHAWENGTPDLFDETVLTEISARGRKPSLHNIFKGHPAWGNMIVTGKSKGTHRLQEPSKR